jgi:uncharacterized protein (DUF342 family)
VENFKDEALQRLVSLEEKYKSTDKRVSNLENRTEHLDRITYIVERQQEQQEKFNNTLVEISQSLKESSVAYKNLDNRVGKLEDGKSNSVSRWIDAGWKIAVAIVILWLSIQLGLGK